MIPNVKRACATCKAFLVNEQRVEDEGTCVRRAPVASVALVPVRHVVHGEGMQPQSFTAWPGVKPEQWCLEWTPNLESAQ